MGEGLAEIRLPELPPEVMSRILGIPGSLPDPSVPAHYAVPGHDAMAFVGAVIDRDAGLETPSQAWCRANALKYLIRAPRKGGVEDYRKAVDYIERLIDLAESS